VYGLATEFIAAACGLGIAVLIAIRLRNRPARMRGRSRFAGSTMWQAYYVEWTIAGIIACVFAIRATRVNTGHFDYPRWATPVSHALAHVAPSGSNGIALLAATKIVISMAWFIVIATNITMGVAWHRFSAFFNIWFKREPERGPALGALPQLKDAAGAPLDFETADPEIDAFGVGSIDQFSWKNLLDFSTCTECGRCQDVCPAWQTGKPLSPKLLITGLRDHTYATAPYLLAGGAQAGAERREAVHRDVLAEAARPLVGGESVGGVLDPDLLWSCTTCGACVQECPVDIEHVDHIVNLRRHQTMMESDFPPETGAMLRNLENRGNPWGMPASAREDWTKGLDFEVTKIAPGQPIADEIEYLFWVGCAGAMDDRAKRTTCAIAELLHTAGVGFAILGKRETCTGDPARRVGNEFLYQGLAQENIATFDEVFANRPKRENRKVVASCAHCFNTIGNEYPQLGGEYTVIHHTQLLAELVRDRRLVPQQPLDENITYHDPCYLGRHNQVFDAPREILSATPGTHFTEMPRNRERSFCCGAGGGRMWAEENLGRRINAERTDEALAGQANTVVTGCPFCVTMLGDEVAARNADGTANNVEVMDVARLLHRSVLPTNEG
ncbi:MAG: (Fe-S)-binding protein, partial [Mycobacteriales bacterium]